MAGNFEVDSLIEMHFEKFVSSLGRRQLEVDLLVGMEDSEMELEYFEV